MTGSSSAALYGSSPAPRRSPYASAQWRSGSPAASSDGCTDGAASSPQCQAASCAVERYAAGSSCCRGTGRQIASHASSLAGQPGGGTSPFSSGTLDGDSPTSDRAESATNAFPH